MTTRNTKGQFARKTAPKKAAKKPTKAQREMERRDALLTEHFRSISEQTSAILKQGDKLDQIQRDIEQVRTLAYQTRTNSRANTVILNKTLAGVDLLKSGSSFMQEIDGHRAATPAQLEEQGLEDGDYCDASPELLADLWKMGFEKDLGGFRPFVNWHAKQRTMITHDVLMGYEDRPLRQLPPADFIARACVTAKKLGLVPEEPKAEQWVPKVGDWVVFLDGTWHAGIHKGAIEVKSGPDSDGHWETVASGDYGGSIFFEASRARPATPEEIAQADGEGKLKKLVRGCRVDTPDGEGIYLGLDGSGEGRYRHWVSLDREAVPGNYCFRLDQLTPLT